MLYIDYIGNHTVRMSNLSGGMGFVRYSSDHIYSRSDELGRIWMEDSDTGDGILNSYPPEEIVVDGTIYDNAEEFVEYFNQNVWIGSVLSYGFLGIVYANDTREVTVEGETKTIKEWFDYLNTEFGLIETALNSEFEALDVSGNDYSSAYIDAYLIYHADTLVTENSTIDIRGNDARTSASDAAWDILDNTNIILFD